MRERRSPHHILPRFFYIDLWDLWHRFIRPRLGRG